ncbi:hypothetical protein ACFY2R_01010 [Micromonospora olivasterospora]|uniref:Tetratricopeptide repeat protein n=1 Tax=Micromonospora olivasterospora TaxID=1880 RepID=A0A562I932_MICOL|nr:hypothetical protein [Micromonospora olivasterospora]TWH67527.1 hypothetical protein JD77_02504 [Micromonospora olivasterospora]
MNDDELWRMLHEASSMPYGAGQTAAVEQLLRRADAGDDRHLAFAARMQATTSYVYGGEPAKSFVTFSWCLAEFDRDPQPYHRRYSHQLLWHFKYMVNAMLKFPELPLDRTYAALDDMERRYRDSGHSLQAVYKYRYWVADHVGDAEAAERWYRLWMTTPRDELSDCAGCDPSSQVGHLSSLGRYEEAVALAEPVLAGRLSCTEQPQAMLTRLLVPYLRTGRHDAARDAHREAYRRLRGNLSDLWEIADHVEFCTLTGNEARAVEIVERHLDWLDRAPTPAAAMHFAATAAAALRGAAGAGDVVLHRRASGDRPAGDVSADVLAAELADTATALAARFDARNGTTKQSGWIARRLAVRPTGEHLPLSASLRRPARPGGPVRVPAAAPAVEVAVPAGATAEELLDLADECLRTHRREGLLAALAAYDERFGAVELSPRTTVRRLELRAGELTHADGPEAARQANRAALAAYRELPDPVREQVVAGRLGVLLCMGGEEPEEGLSLVRGAADFFDGHGDARERAAAHDRVALALVHLGRWEEALAAVDRAATEADVDPWLAARVAVHRAHILEELERPEEFRAAAERACRLARELGVGELIVDAALAYARAVDDPAEMVAACDEALPHAPAENRLPVRLFRARALLAADRPAEAVEDFVEAVTLCVEQGADGDAFLRWELANAYRVAGRPAEAAEVAEEAVLGLDRLGAQAEADRCRHLLAGIYVDLGELDPALDLLEQLARNLDGPDNLPHRAQVLEEAGDLLYDADRDALAAQRFAEAAVAYRLAGAALDELRARRREADALSWAGDVPAAVRAIDVVDGLAAALTGQPEEPPVVTYEVALAAEVAARVLAGDGRPDEALDRLAGVPARLRSIEAFGEAARVELLTGELLARAGRLGEAEPLLREVLGGLPPGSRPAARAAWLLAGVLDEMGRPDEAAAVREEHGLTAGEG